MSETARSPINSDHAAWRHALKLEAAGIPSTRLCACCGCGPDDLCECLCWPCTPLADVDRES